MTTTSAPFDVDAASLDVESSTRDQQVLLDDAVQCLLDAVVMDIAGEWGSEFADLLFPEVVEYLRDRYPHAAARLGDVRLPDVWSVVGMTRMSDYDGSVARGVSPAIDSPARW